MIYDYQNGIYAVDSGYEGVELAAVYLIVDDGHVAVVDTAHNAALEPTLEAMKQLGLSSDRVDYVCLTHVHLDHAGGAGRFMREFPNAKLVVHARGAKHMIDPEKLMAGVREVYGPEETERMYGELVPVPKDRVITPEDGQELQLGSRTIVCMDTPGHAKHHLAFYDTKAGAVFTGDVFGMCYSGLRNGNRIGIVATTSPVQFDPEAMHKSIDRITALHPKAIYPTHFGEIKNVEEIAADLHRQIDAHVKIAEEAKGNIDVIREKLKALLLDESRLQGWNITQEESDRLFRMVIDLNAQGLQVWYNAKHA